MSESHSHDNPVSTNNRPLVTIICPAYNQAHCIRDAIKGFLIQKTSFDFVIIVHDDASTDATPAILREYESRYPLLFNNIYRSDNGYSKGMNIWDHLIANKVKSKYVAICEGDDYWTDPLKLQKQVDYLEGHPDCVLSHSDCDEWYQDAGLRNRNANAACSNTTVCEGAELFRQIIAGRYVVRTATVVFRVDQYQKATSDQFVFRSGYFKMTDTPLWLELSACGKFHYLDESTAVYRVSAGSACRPNEAAKYYRFLLSSSEVRLYYLRKYPSDNQGLYRRIRRSYLIRRIVYQSFDPSFVARPIVGLPLYQRWLIKMLGCRLPRVLIKYCLTVKKGNKTTLPPTGSKR